MTETIIQAGRYTKAGKACNYGAAESQTDMFAMPADLPKPIPAVPVPSAESKAINAVFGEYLEHSIRYYMLDSPVVSDGYFDELCKALLAGWEAITHRYKHMSDKSALSAGTGFQLPFHNLDAIVWLCRRHPETPLKDIYGIKP
ncbi:hypothetical protein [Pseudomonas sp. MWU12-2323]|uniref:DNA ligase LigA-related protein n=1 Tax=Pseudomonas sp. MWU12-2323 TaxID=2651296 RepID=UPI00128BB8C8|nr:hypothetical protein [Pseudomonas sp. MWU12-2323]MPQ71465.1 hypothetical protein [Pseudomonas sp. MWU12-2323]